MPGDQKTISSRLVGILGVQERLLDDWRVSEAVEQESGPVRGPLASHTQNVGLSGKPGKGHGDIQRCQVDVHAGQAHAPSSQPEDELGA